MDFKVSLKETRTLPVGTVDVILPDVFDLFLIFDGDEIVGAEIVEDLDETYQEAYFASVKQRGSDPIDPTDGNRWAEVLIGDVSTEVLIGDIKTSMQSVSSACNVVFSVVTKDGQEYLSYSIQVVTQ